MHNGKHVKIKNRNDEKDLYFFNSNIIREWRIVNDGVMGGIFKISLMLII
jgi:hypothetical protein